MPHRLSGSMRIALLTPRAGAVALLLGGVAQLARGLLAVGVGFARG